MRMASIDPSGDGGAFGDEDGDGEGKGSCVGTVEGVASDVEDGPSRLHPARASSHIVSTGLSVETRHEARHSVRFSTRHAFASDEDGRAVVIRFIDSFGGRSSGMASARPSVGSPLLGSVPLLPSLANFVIVPLGIASLRGEVFVFKLLKGSCATRLRLCS